MKKQILGYLTELIKVEIDNMAADETIYIKRIVDLNEENSKIKEENKKLKEHLRWLENLKVMANDLKPGKRNFNDVVAENKILETKLKQSKIELLTMEEASRKQFRALRDNFKTACMENKFKTKENDSLKNSNANLNKIISKLSGPRWVD